jgi:hypothetical protein
VDIDAAGGLATGGLIAAAVEKPTGEAGEHNTGACTDCGQPTSGNFCSNCGQPTHVHRTLLHLGEELLHGVMHFDGRIWRTLPLLVLNPGRLTREWIEGKRTRYVSPLAIFLFTLFVMFFAISFGMGAGAIQVSPLPERIAAARVGVAESEAALAAAQARAAAGEPGAAGVAAGLTQALEGSRGTLRALEEAQAAGPRTDGLSPGSWQAYLADAAHEGRVKVGMGDKKMQEKVIHKLENPDFAVYKIQQTAYKFAFLLVPLSIPFVWLMFAWKRGFTWYDHGVFVLYSLTFMAMLTLLMLVIGRFDGWFTGLIGAMLTFAVPAHMFAQLKGTYGLSIFSAAWRTFALLIFCTIALTLFLLTIVMLGLAG